MSERITTLQACQILGISAQTFSSYKQKGCFKSWGFGNADFYEKEEILRFREMTKQERKNLMKPAKKEVKSE